MSDSPSEDVPFTDVVTERRLLPRHLAAKNGDIVRVTKEQRERNGTPLPVGVEGEVFRDEHENVVGARFGGSNGIDWYVPRRDVVIVKGRYCGSKRPHEAHEHSLVDGFLFKCKGKVRT